MVSDMKQVIKDNKYRFVSAFDSETGFYIRTGILDDQGKDTGVDPFMASFPHLIDVGVMGHCIHGKTGLCVKAGIGCYQSGLLVEKPNMTVENFRWICEQCKGRCNQLALGGRGDPDQHEQFEELVNIFQSLYHFTSPVAMYKGSYNSSSSSTLVIICLFLSYPSSWVDSISLYFCVSFT